MIITKKVLQSDEARLALLRGVDALANPVKATLGPGGRLVVIGRRAIGQTPHTTKDGVTVANAIEPSDPIEQMGADIVREAAQRTVDNAGDGTTTATVLAQSMVHSGMRMLATGASPFDLKRGMELATARIISELDGRAIPVSGDMVQQIAVISANGDEEVGRIVAHAVAQVGKDGVVTCEESKTTETHLEVVNGLHIPSGYNDTSAYFVTDLERMRSVLEDSYLLLVEGKVGNPKSLLPLLTKVSETGRPLLCIAGDYEPEALAVFVVNRVKGGMRLCAIRSAAYGSRRREILRDIAALTGGRAITDDLGIKIENLTLADLGQAKRIVVDRNRTTITEGMGSASEVDARVSDIRRQMEKAEEVAKAQLQERLAGLTGGIAVIKVGAATETEMREKKDRVEDAMHAADAAIDEGIVPGGGVALLRAADAAFDADLPAKEKLGAQIVYGACHEPLIQIARNAGKSGDAVADRVLGETNPNFGFNARTGTYEDLVASGVIDPVRVVKEALKNASSVAAMILSTEALIAEIPEKKHE